jgi:cell wall-associated NlpC family hydrolase
MRAGLLNHMDVISFYDAQPGDVLWIKWPRAAYPMHLAIVTEAGRVLHADGSPKIKKVVEHGLPSSWAGYVASTLRWNIWVNG